MGFGCLGLAAQEAPGSGMQRPQGAARRDRVEGRLQRMSERLNLTDEQKEKLRPILQDEFKQLKALRADNSLSQDARRAKAREIRRSTRQQIGQILTPEQKEKMKERRRNARRQRGGAAQQPPPTQ